MIYIFSTSIDLFGKRYFKLKERDNRSEPETFGPIPACRNNHTTAVYGDKIYFHGGHDGNQWLDDLYVLNTSSLVWSKPKVSGQVRK